MPTLLKSLGPLDRRIVALALPALAALLVEPIYNLTDSAIVGHLGARPLAALAIAGGALTIVGWTASFVEMATVSMVATRRGAGDDAGAGRAVGAAYAVSAALGLVVAGLLALLAPVLVALLGGHGVTGSDALLYLRISSVGFMPLLVSLAGNGHLVGVQDTRTPLLVAVLANGVNVALELVLVYGLQLGIAGSAWGTVAAQCVSAVLFVLLSRRAVIAPRRPTREEIERLARDGARLTVRTAALGLTLLTTTAIASRLSTVVLAAHEIGLQVFELGALALDAVAVPAQVFVGEALGGGDHGQVRNVGRRTLLAGLVSGLAAAVLLAAVSWALPSVFSSNAAVEHQATQALLVCAALLPIGGVAFVLDGLLLGASRYDVLQRVMLTSLLGFAPMAIATGLDHRLGIVGVWLALLCWMSLRTAILLRWWLSGRWERPG